MPLAEEEGKSFFLTWSSPTKSVPCKINQQYSPPSSTTTPCIHHDAHFCYCGSLAQAARAQTPLEEGLIQVCHGGAKVDLEVRRDGSGVALITINNPPVNSLSGAVREGLIRFPIFLFPSLLCIFCQFSSLLQLNKASLG